MLCAEKKPKILMISETHVTSDFDDSELEINGYNLIRCDSNSRHTGGVAMYIDESVDFNVVCKLVKSKTWILSVKINNHLMTGLYAVVYKSPSEKINDFLNTFDEFCDEHINDENDNVITGDFNINVARKSKNVNKYLDVIKEYNLEQIIEDYTRENTKAKTKTIIDHVLTNNRKNLKYSINKKDHIGDHFMIEIKCNVKTKSKKSDEKYEITSWKKYDATKMKDLICDIKWDDELKSDVNKKSEFLVNNLSECVNKLVSKVKVFKNSNQWYNDDLRKMKKKKDELFKKYEMSNDLDHKTEWEKLSKTYKEMIKKAKCDFIQLKIEENKNDQKKMWQTLKSLYKKKEENIKKVIFNDEEVTEKSEIGRKLNEFYVNSVDRIVKEIPNPNRTNYNENIEKRNCRFTIEQITMNELKNIISEIKNKGHVDNINGKVIKDAMKDASFANFLLNFVNDCIEESEMPINMKTSIINPIPKKPNPMLPEDYRPINMLPIIEKILEIAVKNQLVAFIDENDMLIRQQSGFRKAHSCETAINLLLANWMSDLHESKEIIAVFLDFKRAFETIDRENMLAKLKIYGGDEKTIRWFRSYLSDRQQQLKIDDYITECHPTKIGLPQGSVLAPILFVIYINDIDKILQHSTVNLFADDTALSVADVDPVIAAHKMNEDLNRLEDWLRFNKLALNIKKTNFLHISNKTNSPKFQLKINGEEIIKVKDVKYLGVKIDDKLKFTTHFHYIKAKMSKKLGLLRRIAGKLTKQSKVTFYKTIIGPHLDYCATILFLLNKTQIEELQKIQNKCMRILLIAKKETHIVDMLEKLEFLSVSQRIHANTLKFFYKIENSLCPNYLAERLVRRSLTTNYCMRSGETFNIPNYKSTVTQNSLFFKGTQLFNQFKKKNHYSNLEEFLKKTNLYVKSQ
jgi:Reverse transcriptase (RNA-dependent DNA polymerase)